MSLNIAAIHNIFKTELNIKYPDLKLILEGQSKVAPGPPRITFLDITEGRTPRQSTEKNYSDPDGVPTTTYKDYVYDTYRYNVIVNEDSKTDAGKSFIVLLKDIIQDFHRFIKTDSFSFLMEPLQISYTLITEIKDATINKLPFFEKRKFFDVRYGYNDEYSREEGSFIETFGIENLNPI